MIIKIKREESLWCGAYRGGYANLTQVTKQLRT